MLFSYKAIDKGGSNQEGTIDAVNMDVAIGSLQKRDLVIYSIDPVDEEGSGWNRQFNFLTRVKNKDIVILSRQIATLFEAQVSALRVFKLLAAETANPVLRKSLIQVTDDLQGGSSISKALVKHPKIFSEFYVNMVKAGEESGKLDQTFSYLADYLDRTYEVTAKARGALIYPAFVVAMFLGVMILMFTVVVPKISLILVESGQDLPIYTKIIFVISDFTIDYGIFVLIALIIGGFFLGRYIRTPEGKVSWSSFKLGIPLLGDLYRKLYLSRIADNMHTMIASGISMVKAIEVTSTVVGNEVYRQVLSNSGDALKGGNSLSKSLSVYEEIPGILVQMIKVGEETGELGSILKTMAKFYQREVNNAVDSLVDLIEPVMIVVLGLGVGILLAAVLTPIYNIASSF